jgi:hypothetical protein
MNAHEVNECWARLARKNEYADLVLNDEERKILGALDIESLKDFEIMNAPLKKLKLPRTARRVLIRLRSDYWQEVTFQRVIRMVEANIAVANGASWR